MFDLPDSIPRTDGTFSLPLLAQAALYHAKGVRAEATFEAVLGSGPDGPTTAVAAGAWWATRLALGPLSAGDDEYAQWAAGRAASVGAEREAAAELLLRPFSGHVHALVAGTVVATGAPVLQVTGPLPEVYVRSMLFGSAMRLAVGAASAARLLVEAASGRSVIDDASVRSGSAAPSSLLAWCGRVGGMAGTTHSRAGWEWAIPVVSVPQQTGLPAEPTDGTVDADDIHTSTMRLARERTDLRRVRLSRARVDESDLDRHRVLRRALDRHGLRRTRICAQVDPTPDAVRQLAGPDSPIDLLVLNQSWWKEAPMHWMASVLPSALKPPARPAWSLEMGRHQLQRRGDLLIATEWSEHGLLRRIAGVDCPLPTVPTVLPASHPLRGSISPDLQTEGSD